MSVNRKVTVPEGRSVITPDDELSAPSGRPAKALKHADGAVAWIRSRLKLSYWSTVRGHNTVRSETTRPTAWLRMGSTVRVRQRLPGTPWKRAGFCRQASAGQPLGCPSRPPSGSRVEASLELRFRLPAPTSRHSL